MNAPWDSLVAMHIPRAAQESAVIPGADLSTFAPGGGRSLLQPWPFHSQPPDVFMAKQNVGDPHDNIRTEAGIGFGPGVGWLQCEPFQITVVRRFFESAPSPRQ